MAQLNDGFIDYLVCTDCLTRDEYIAMHMRAAITDFAIAPDGRILCRPKVSGIAS